jgi:hypothetical protein
MRGWKRKSTKGAAIGLERSTSFYQITPARLNQIRLSMPTNLVQFETLATGKATAERAADISVANDRF